MKLLVIRHGKAGDRKDFSKSGKTDSERPLTEEGYKDLQISFSALKKIVDPVDFIFTSPLVRAKQTAEVLHSSFPKADVAITPFLSPESDFEKLIQLIAQKKGETLAIVGHEPHLSGFVSWALSSSPKTFLKLKKGAVALVEFQKTIAPSKGELIFLLQPRHFKEMVR